VAGELPIDATLPQIWVEDDAQAGRARQLIGEFLRPAPGRPPVKCPKCGEENPGSFDLCWHCGSDLTAAK
jgi:hypothetical protein